MEKRLAVACATELGDQLLCGGRHQKLDEALGAGVVHSREAAGIDGDDAVGVEQGTVAFQERDELQAFLLGQERGAIRERVGAALACHA